MKKQKKNNEPNLVDMIPHQSTKHRAETDEKGQVTIFVENTGPFNFMAQKLFHKPRFSQIHLEKFGSFIWKQVDGKKTVGEIAELLGKEFGAEADPLYPRLAMYIKTLTSYEFIYFEKLEK